MKEMLGENNEYGIVTENSEDVLYEGIKKLLDHPALLAHYQQQANLRGKDFSTENTVKAVENLLLEV
jgi:glycosyltransferase involved in cell wall biosynthesis